MMLVKIIFSSTRKLFFLVLSLYTLPTKSANPRGHLKLHTNAGILSIGTDLTFACNLAFIPVGLEFLQTQSIKSWEDMSLAKIKNNVSMSFRLSGLNIKSDALTYLAELLSPIDPSEHGQWLERIIDLVLKQGLASPVVEQKHVEAAAIECGKNRSEDSENFFNVISAFEVPHYVYVADKKKYLPSSMAGVPDSTIYADAAAKGALFRERYVRIQQRTARHELFSPSVGLGGTQPENSTKFKMVPIEFLLGTTAKLKDVVVLGMLTQLKEGRFFLEDPSGSVPLDLSETQFQGGLFTESCFVLTEGWYEDGLYHVKGIGFPPAEPASTTRAYFGNANFFGGPSQTSVKSSNKLKALEQVNPDAIMIFLSDIWLDQQTVMDKLRILLDGYSGLQPFAVVFMGNFLSSAKGSHDIAVLKTQFRKLGEMISEHPGLEKTKFVFVPGPNDPGFPAILPRPPLPKYLTDGLTQRVPNAIFTTNPCRIQYGTKEIIVFREDLVTRMCRNCLHFPANSDIPEHFVKTLVSQCHLSPLPMTVRPIYWAYDNALSVYPLPDLVVIGDKFEPFNVANTGANVVNPGSFSRSQFCFKVYYPATGQVDDSQIGDE